MMFRQRVPVRIALLGALLFVSSLVMGDDPWDAPPMTADPQAMLAAAGELPYPEDEPIEILLLHGLFQIDEEGRITQRLHRVYRTATDEAARDWALTEAEWSPWYQQRPTIRARVIRPSGEVLELDPQTIVESGVRQFDPTVMRDQRVLQVPLPGVAAGAIVEEVVEWNDERPFFAAGVLERFDLGHFFSTRRARVQMEAPSDITLRHEIRGMEVTPVIVHQDGRVRVTYDVGAVPGIDDVEPDGPPDVPVIPYVVFSTGKSWRAVAAAYAAQIEPRMDVPSVKALVDEALTGDESPREAAIKLLAKLRELVRYTGLQFGESAIIPYLPQETLARRYGDCKDQAVLFAAMLRAAGHEAHVALVRAGTRHDVSPQLPALNAFNHAIVVLSGEAPLWIDPTTPYLPPGTLPAGAQGKSALIVRADATELSRTPPPSAAENVISESTRVQLTSQAKANLSQVFTWTGAAAGDRRQSYAQSRQTELEKSWQDYCDNIYGSGELSRLDFSDPRETLQPFRVEVEFKDVEWGHVDIDEALIGLDASEVFDNLPWYLQFEDDETEDEDRAEGSAGLRQHPLHWPLRHVRENVVRVVPPDGYALRSLPEARNETFGGASFSRRYQQDGESVIATFRFETGDQPLSPEHVAALRATIVPLVEQSHTDGYTQELSWDHSANHELARGEFAAAFKTHRELVAAHSEEPLYSDAYVQALLYGGFGAEAQRIARQAVEAMPSSPEAWSILGYALMHDAVGRDLRCGYDRRACEEAFLKAIELGSESSLPRWNLAVVLEHDAFGHRYVLGEDLDRAMALYREIEDWDDVPAPVYNNLGMCLYYSGRHDELAELIEQHETVSPELQLAVITVTRGVPAAKRRVKSLANTTGEQVRLLLMAAVLLDRGRQYELAAKMYEAGAAAAADPRAVRDGAAVLATFKSWEQTFAPADRPEHCVQQVLAAVATHGLKKEQIQEYTANTALDSVELTQWELHMRAGRLLALQTDSPPHRQRDAVTTLTLETEGSAETGYRIRVRSSDTAVGTFYVVPADGPEPGRYRVLLSGSAHAELGLHALQLLRASRPESAHQWLDWADDALEAGSWLNAFSGAPFKRIWGAVQKDDVEALKVAAAALAAPQLLKDDARFLETAIETETSAARKLQLQRALCALYTAQKADDELLALTAALREQYPWASEPRLQQLAMYHRSKQTDKARAAATEWLKAPTDDAILVSYVAADLANDAGQFEEGLRILERLLEQHSDSPLALNSAAWQALYADSDLETAIDRARRACELTGNSESSLLHTLATLLAAAGEVSQAHSVLFQAIEARGEDTVDAHDWYTIGRMAEHCELHEAAAEAYQRAIAEDDGDIARLASLRKGIIGRELP